MNLENWANKDFWSESELRDLCCGLEPGSDRTSALQAINEASEDIRRAVLAGALPCTSPSDATAGDKFYGHDRFFKPKDAMRWATPKFPNFPFPAPEEFTSAATADRLLLDKPLGTRERETLLTIIAALCDDAGYDSAKHAKTAGLIQGMAAGMGVSIGETTIESYLKKIPDALAKRMK